MSTFPSRAKIAQATPIVKAVLPLAVLPVGVNLSADGQWLMRTCPVCGAVGKVGVYPGQLDEALAKITRRAWVCRACELDMEANGLAWTPEASDLLQAIPDLAHCTDMMAFYMDIERRYQARHNPQDPQGDFDYSAAAQEWREEFC